MDSETVVQTFGVQAALLHPAAAARDTAALNLFWGERPHRMTSQEKKKGASRGSGSGLPTVTLMLVVNGVGASDCNDAAYCIAMKPGWMICDAMDSSTKGRPPRLFTSVGENIQNSVVGKRARAVRGAALGPDVEAVSGHSSQKSAQADGCTSDIIDVSDGIPGRMVVGRAVMWVQRGRGTDYHRILRVTVASIRSISFRPEQLFNSTAPARAIPAAACRQ